MTALRVSPLPCGGFFVFWVLFCFFKPIAAAAAAAAAEPWTTGSPLNAWREVSEQRTLAPAGG